MRPKVTMGIALFGAEEYIGRAAESFFEQTYDDIEYIIVNDCTPDNSISVLSEVVERYPRRKAQVRIINNTYNIGVASTRNVILDNATGEYIFFADPDDWIDADLIEKLVSRAIESNADIVLPDLIIHEKEGDRIKSPKDYSSNLFYLKAILKRSETTGMYKMYKANLFCGVRFVPNINVTEDYIVNSQLFRKATNVVTCHGPFYHYNRFNENSLTHTPSQKALVDEMKGVAVVSDLYKAEDIELKQLTILTEISTICNCLINYAKNTSYTECYALARQHLDNIERRWWGICGKGYKLLLILAPYRFVLILYARLGSAFRAYIRRRNKN